MENAERAVRRHPVIENAQQREFHVGPEMFRPNENNHFDLERDEVRLVDLDVVARHSKRIEILAHRVLERVVHGQSAKAIHGDEDGAPTPCPAKTCGGALHFRMAFGNMRVIIDGYGPLLGAKSVWGMLADILNAFGFGSASGGEGISDALYIRIVRDDMNQSVCSNVPGCAVADAIGSGE